MALAKADDNWYFNILFLHLSPTVAREDSNVAGRGRGVCWPLDGSGAISTYLTLSALSKNTLDTSKLNEIFGNRRFIINAIEYFIAAEKYTVDIN